MYIYPRDKSNYTDYFTDAIRFKQRILDFDNVFEKCIFYKISIIKQRILDFDNVFEKCIFL
jgi:hypothetical protein